MAALKVLCRGHVRFAGIGGPRMSEQGLSSLFSMRELSVMGLAEVASPPAQALTPSNADGGGDRPAAAGGGDHHRFAGLQFPGVRAPEGRGDSLDSLRGALGVGVASESGPRGGRLSRSLAGPAALRATLFRSRGVVLHLRRPPGGGKRRRQGRRRRLPPPPRHRRRRHRHLRTARQPARRDGAAASRLRCHPGPSRARPSAAARRGADGGGRGWRRLPRRRGVAGAGARGRRKRAKNSTASPHRTQRSPRRAPWFWSWLWPECPPSSLIVSIR